MFALFRRNQIKKKKIKLKMGRKLTIRKHATEQEIKLMYRESTNYKVTLRLLAVMNLYNGKTMRDTADFLMISYSNLKTFLKKWNEEGIRSIQNYGSTGYNRINKINNLKETKMSKLILAIAVLSFMFQTNVFAGDNAEDRKFGNNNSISSEVSKEKNKITETKKPSEVKNIWKDMPSYDRFGNEITAKARENMLKNSLSVKNNNSENKNITEMENGK